MPRAFRARLLTWIPEEPLAWSITGVSGRTLSSSAFVSMPGWSSRSGFERGDLAVVEDGGVSFDADAGEAADSERRGRRAGRRGLLPAARDRDEKHGDSTSG